jgi:hypothetical protein
MALVSQSGVGVNADAIMSQGLILVGGNNKVAIGRTCANLVFRILITCGKKDTEENIPPIPTISGVIKI